MNLRTHVYMDGFRSRAMSLVSVVMLAAALLSSAHAQQATSISGTVRDRHDAAIVNATVSVYSASWRYEVSTAADGTFQIDVPASSGTLSVHATGFREFHQEWNAASSTRPLAIILEVDANATTVTVSATRTELPISQSSAAVTVLDNSELQSTAAATLDDALRQSAGFSTFRRSSSRTANPTTEGVSLRGIGSSGAGRALVLADGVPLNDAFGGWVYWDRIPRESIERVEILHGGASDLYGSSALSGVIDVARRSAVAPEVSVAVDYGSENTPNASGTATERFGNWAATAAAEGFRTGGYVLVDPAERGTVDVPANSEHRAGEATVGRTFGAYGNFFLRGSLFRESRNNGTPLTVNSTSLGQVSSGLNWNTSALGDISFRVFATGQQYRQTFSSAAANRNSETLARTQQVPSQQGGISAQWRRALGLRNVVIAGVDVSDVRGHSDELIFAASGAATSRTDAGGRQRTVGIFAGDVVHASSRVLINFSARADHWTNLDAFRTNLAFTPGGVPSTTPFADQGRWAFSPRGGVIVRGTSHLSLSASAFHSFRAPTLNELYRTFRIGNVFTQANENLRAERLAGAEGGIIASGRPGTLRATFFYARVSDPVANVTLLSTPALITRQRQNLGHTRSRGLDVDFDSALWHRWTVTAGYEFADAIVTDFAADRRLEGLEIPQVPRHQFTAQVRYVAANRFTVSVQMRAAGRQFDDDLNQLPLAGYFVADAFASYPLFRHTDVFAGVENIFDQRYSVARTPVTSLGPPALVRAGVRIQFGRR